MAQLANFNRLRTKPEYIEKVMRLMKKHKKLNLSQIIMGTKLTMTQVKCTLDHLMSIGQIARSDAEKVFVYQEIENDTD